MSEELEKLSVLELRKLAKEMGVKLGAGINKQGIIEKLAEARGDNREEEPQQPMHRPIRSAAIITDDEAEDDDIPILTPNAPMNRPSAPRPASPAANGGASSLSGISAKAPAFTMEGSRAWNNPRPYQNSQPGYQRTQNTWSSARPAAAPQRAWNAAPQKQAAPASYTPRFGPEQAAPEPQPPAAPVNDYRPAHYGAPQQDYQAADAQSYQAYPQQQPAARPAHYQAAPAPGPTLSELLTAGDVGDGEGVLEMHPDGYGILRSTVTGKKDIYIANAQIRRFALRTGDYVVGKTRPQRESDRYVAMLYITDVNGHAAEEVKARPAFDSFTAIYPKKRINLSGRSQDEALRLIDLLSPMGFGQRALITCKTHALAAEMLKKLAAAVSRNYPKALVKVLLVNESPEDVTETRDALKADVIATTFDQSPEDQQRAFDLLTERVQRLVEDGRDVVLLLDSLTQMARICNQLIPSSARTLQNGLAAGAMLRPKRLFGSARNTREAGSLTVIAFAVNETALDGAALEEIKGTPNMEILLTGEGGLGFDPLSVRTKKSELLMTEQEKHVSDSIREMLSASSPDEALAQLRSMLEKTENNDDLVQKFDSWMGM